MGRVKVGDVGGEGQCGKGEGRRCGGRDSVGRVKVGDVGGEGQCGKGEGRRCGGRGTVWEG